MRKKKVNFNMGAENRAERREGKPSGEILDCLLRVNMFLYRSFEGQAEGAMERNIKCFLSMY